jgi:hypothetical protein
MIKDPFDEELEKDTIVPGDSMSNPGQPKTVETVEDFKRQLCDKER